MDAGEVMKNVVEQTNNVTTGNETNSELETVPPNRFTLLFKIPCIYIRQMLIRYVHCFLDWQYNVIYENLWERVHSCQNRSI